MLPDFPRHVGTVQQDDGAFLGGRPLIAGFGLLGLWGAVEGRLWIAAAFLFISRFFGYGRADWLRAWPWAAVLAAGFFLWLWGMKWA